MDGITLFEASIFYSLLLCPLLSILLLLFWEIKNRKNNNKTQSPVTLLIFILQMVYYVLFFILIGAEYHLAMILLCILPILSIIQLYPWTFGKKTTSNGRIIILIVFIIQVILTFSNIVLSLMTINN